MKGNMDFADLTLCCVFWCAAAGAVYTYLGYPIVIFGLSRLVRRPLVVPANIAIEPPRVALLIAAHNEAAVIEQRIQNALELQYRRDRLDIVIASDGSDDATPAICKENCGHVRLLDFPTRRGKAAVLNAAVELLDTDVVVFSDANTLMDAHAIQCLARWFIDPEVGAVCGRLILSDARPGANVDSVYWRYETFLKSCEGRLGSLLGANGAIYAIRRSVFVPFPPGTLVDDFVGPLLAKISSGCRIIYDMQAEAFEESAPDLHGEYRRRMRIGTGGFQSLAVLWPLLLPRFGWTAFSFWSHKVLRWLCPFCLLAALLASALLSKHTLYRDALLAQLFFYALCGLGAIKGAGRSLRTLTMFACMNFALLAGFIRWMAGNQNGVWLRTQRSQNSGRMG